MIRTHVLGFPRIGAQRELKFALERHWRGEIGADELEATGRELRRRHWALQRAHGLDCVTVGDFAFYDQVANHIQLFGCEPARFGFRGDEPALARYFTLARGVAAEPAAHACGHDHAALPAGSAALEMTKWFDTNYHYLVPEFDRDTRFSLHPQRLLAEVAEAQAQGHSPKVALIGPLSLLWLGKSHALDPQGAASDRTHPAAQAGQPGNGPSVTRGFDRLDLLDALIPRYVELLQRLGAAGVQWVQLDEPILGLDLPPAWLESFQPAYHALNAADVSVLLATYFSPLQDNLALACRLPVAGLHVDAVRAADELPALLEALPAERELSIGIVDGRNIWRTDLDRALALLRPAFERRRRLWIAP